MYSRELQLKQRLIEQVCFLSQTGRVEMFKAMCKEEPNIDKVQRCSILHGLKTELFFMDKSKLRTSEWYENVSI